jgi:protein-S-isoprenylcysteine O-methyltransferase Ste14
MSTLRTKVLASLSLLFLAMAALLLVPPRTFDQAWTFLAVYFGAPAANTLYLMKKDPPLLARRTGYREYQTKVRYRLIPRVL